MPQSTLVMEKLAGPSTQIHLPTLNTFLFRREIFISVVFPSDLDARTSLVSITYDVTELIAFGG